MDDNKKIAAKHVFLFIFTVASLGFGGYLLYEYERIKKANASVATPQEAKDILKQVLTS